MQTYVQFFNVLFDRMHDMWIDMWAAECILGVACSFGAGSVMEVLMPQVWYFQS